MKMFSNEVRDSINDFIDFSLASTLRSLIYPAFCIGLAFYADTLGFFDSIFPDAGPGLLTFIGAGFWASLMVVRMYFKGELAAPSPVESSESE